MDGFYHLFQGTQSCTRREFAPFPGKRFLLGRQVRHIIEQEALLIHQIELVPCLFFTEALELHFCKDLPDDPHTGSTSPETQESLVRQFFSGSFQPAQDGR